MHFYRTSIWLLPALFLFNTLFADVSSASYPLRIKVLRVETHALNAETPVPKDCDLQNYSAYCNGSRNPSAQSVMLVQDGEGKSFSITCTADTRWSRCAPLTEGGTFEARKEKHGITVLYRNPKGKERKQLYQLVAAVVPPEPAPALPPNSPGPEQAQKLRCTFTSTPSGAEITLDGKYVGNTPSTIGVGAGTHIVGLSMPGFVQWKREFTVSAGSEVNVTASLKKTQP